MFGLNQFQNHQAVNKYPTPYQFPATSSGINPYMPNDDLALVDGQGYGLKFGNDPNYGTSGLDTQSQYGPPMMQTKGEKMKGAALSALTLLAFLFFLNLLQSCIKDQMDVMNPTVMVSAGQRNYLLSRNTEQNDEVRKVDEVYDVDDSTEQFTDDKDRDYDSDDYRTYPNAPEGARKRPPTPTRKEKTKRKRTRPKSRTAQVSTMESKINHYYKDQGEVNSSM